MVFKRLRSKLLISMLTVVVLLTAAVLAVVQLRMRRHVREDLAATLATESAVYQKLQEGRRAQEQQSASLIADQPSLKALMSTDDRLTIQDGSESLLQPANADLLILQGQNGELLAFHCRSDDVAVSGMKRLMQGSNGAHDFWYSGGHLFDMSFASIAAGAGAESRALGRMALGREVSPQSLRDNALFGGSLLAFTEEGKVLQSSLSSREKNEFEDWLQGAPNGGSQVQELNLNGERFLAQFVTLPGSHAVRLYFLRSYDQATSFLQELDRMLLILGILAVLMGSTVAFMLSRQITRPVETLALGAREMQLGNFDFQLRAEGGDEVAELTRSFEQMRNSIRESRDGMLRAARLEAVGRLAGGVAHDFNNLVTIINGYSDLVLGSATEENRPWLEEIKRAGQRASALTRQLLAFSRKQVLEPQVLDPNQTVRNMVKMLTVLIGEDVELVTSLSDKVGRVRVDPGQLEQVIMNLAVNARDAMPEGGKLIIETKACELDEEYARAHAEVTPGAFAMIAVTDTGAGMGQETMKHIFEPFFTTKETGKGTGLGLATVYGILKQSKGHIGVYSEVGIGTTFKVFLPSVDSIAGAIVEQLPAEPPRGEGVILLVEDEPALRVLAAESLKRLGYTVLQAGNGLEALAVADQCAEHIDIVVTDMVMPRMGGVEFVQKLREKRAGFAVIFVSGYTDAALLETAALDAHALVLSKPFTTEALARRISEAQRRNTQVRPAAGPQARPPAGPFR